MGQCKWTPGAYLPLAKLPYQLFVSVAAARVWRHLTVASLRATNLPAIGQLRGTTLLEGLSKHSCTSGAQLGRRIRDNKPARGRQYIFAHLKLPARQLSRRPEGRQSVCTGRIICAPRAFIYLDLDGQFR